MKVAPRSIYYYERGDAPVCGRLQYLARTILSLREIFGKLWLVGLVVQFSVWVKHYYAVSFFSFGSYSAHFLDFKLDSAQTESSPILRPALCGHAYPGRIQDLKQKLTSQILKKSKGESESGNTL